MKKNYKSILILVILIFILTLYIINTSYIISSILSYTELFFKNIFPANFVFFTFSSLLLDYGIINFINRFFNTGGSCIYLFFVSMISGFPSGAKYTKELYDNNYIDLDTANKYLMFSHFPNPIFILGSVSNVIGKNASLILLFSIIICNFFIMLIIKKSDSRFNIKNSHPSSFSSSLTKGLISSFKCTLLIYGTSLFFYLISIIVNKYFYFNIFIYVFTSGIFDLTNGIFSSVLVSNYFIKILLIIFFIVFGSISIHMQVLSIISDSNIDYKYYLKGRIISFFVVSFLFYMFYQIKNLSFLF